MTNKRRQWDNNVTFFVYFNSIMYQVAHTPRISVDRVETYKDIVWFKVGMHHMYVQAKKDLARQ
jgi:hypothetical protein